VPGHDRGSGKQFRPDFGTITAYRSPGGFGVRLDAGSAYPGARITPYYDSLLVKMSTWGLTLRDAAQIMNRSLEEFRLRGVKSNIGFLENVIRHPTFLSGKCDTSFIDSIRSCSRSRWCAISPTSCCLTSAITVNGYPGIKEPLISRICGTPKVPSIPYDLARPPGSPMTFWKRAPTGLSSGFCSRSSC
jgi:pyruvate carboxylase